MSYPTEGERAPYVRKMFARIAHRYDLLNRLMTLGQDQRWRKEAIRRLGAPPHGTLIDIGCGTGDLAFEAARQHPGALVIASDFTPEMIAHGKQRPGGKAVNWVIADAQNLPFAAGCADGIVSGFLLRNVPHVKRALREQHRTLRPGGRFVALDTTPPRPGPLTPLLALHFNYIIPLLGKLIAGDAEAYTYLPDSTANFLLAEALVDVIQQVGFTAVSFVRRMLGTVAIHWGIK